MTEYKKQYPILHSSVIKELCHGAVVSNLAYELAQRMKLPDEMCHNLAIAGFLHDIGKLELAKYVRKKEHKTLVIEELRYVRRHSNLGAMILKDKGYSDEIVEMVKFHHENYDGSGYPQNLEGEDIPLGAKIIRVCDVFAALTADRPYRKAFDINTALKLMIDEAKYYDVRVFMTFMNMVHSGEIQRILDTEELEKKLTLFGEFEIL